jgi:hypothetical protein
MVGEDGRGCLASRRLRARVFASRRPTLPPAVELTLFYDAKLDVAKMPA